MNTDEWTVRTLKEYFEQRFKDQQIAVDAALHAAKEAVTKAEAASEKRFEGVNEFRETLADQQRTLMPRAESEFKWNAMDQRVTTLEKAFVKLSGERTGSTATWALVVGGIGLIGIVIGIVAAVRGWAGRP